MHIRSPTTDRNMSAGQGLSSRPTVYVSFQPRTTCASGPPPLEEVGPPLQPKMLDPLGLRTKNTHTKGCQNFLSVEPRTPPPPHPPPPPPDENSTQKHHRLDRTNGFSLVPGAYLGWPTPILKAGHHTHLLFLLFETNENRQSIPKWGWR